VIDYDREHLIALRDVPRHTPGRPHVATVYRWTMHPKHPLETVKVGGRVYTSIEAIRRFIAVCSGAMPEAPSKPTRQRAAAIKRAERRLAAAGIR